MTIKYDWDQNDFRVVEAKDPDLYHMQCLIVVNSIYYVASTNGFVIAARFG